MSKQSQARTCAPFPFDSDSDPKRKVEATVSSAVDWLKRHSSKSHLAGMARFAIPSTHAFGVPMAKIQSLAKRLGKSHDLAAGLWATGHYEARLLAAFVDEPGRVTGAQMDRWCRDFDSWAVCDTVCFHLFDRTTHAWGEVKQWSPRREEFIKRAAFALLWGLTVHDKSAGDDLFLDSLPLIEGAATDDRNFVKKAVNMALRAIGKRNRSLNTAAVTLAQRLATSPDSTARWIGKDTLRELASPAVTRRLAAKHR